jgi:hypothetical protein
MIKMAKAGRAAGLFVLFALSLGTALPAHGGQALVPLAQPGPWSAVSGLIGYGDRLWFVNSVKFVNHNSADVYSYDPRSGAVRYERHLFSQDTGEPVVADGLLYWPFEDPRFSPRRGEYMVTNGRDWQWRALRDGEAFHVHAMAADGDVLYAAPSAWRAGVQRSDDGGASWRVIYDHATEPGFVTHIKTLEMFQGTLYAGLTDRREAGPRLLRWNGKTMEPMPGWPEGNAVIALAPFDGWLYALGVTRAGRGVWRTDGTVVERVAGLDDGNLRDLAAGAGALWAVSGSDGGGALWRSTDGLAWSAEQRFERAAPVDVATYAGHVYVGTIGPDGRGALWGPRPPAAAAPALDGHALPTLPARLSPDQAKAALSEVERLLAEPEFDRRSIVEALRPFALRGGPEDGAALAALLAGALPTGDVRLFGGNVRRPAARVAHWYLLWAMAHTGGGRAPPGALAKPWTQPPNRPEKYMHPVEATAWAVAQIGQADSETLGALIDRLGNAGDPDWLDGDLIGALTALTGERFGYDHDAWRNWWERRQP